MNKSLILGIVIGALVITAGAAVAGFDFMDRKPKFAEVLNVSPVSEKVRTPREVCNDVAVTRTKPVKDENRIAGSVIGAVVGGVLGSQVGSGNGRKVATAAGAAAGGYAGNKTQQQIQQKNTYTETERRCSTAYDVKYQLGKETGTVRMDRDPGQRIPVQDGRLVLDGVVNN